MAALIELKSRYNAAYLAWDKTAHAVESMHMDEIVSSVVDLKLTSEVGYASLFNTRADFVQMMAAFAHLRNTHIDYVLELEELGSLTDHKIPIMSVKDWFGSCRRRLHRLISKYYDAAWNHVVPALDFLEEEVIDALGNYEQATDVWCPERELLEQKWVEFERAVVRLCPMFTFNNPTKVEPIYSRYNRLVERYNSLLEQCWEEAVPIQTAAEGPSV